MGHCFDVTTDGHVKIHDITEHTHLDDIGLVYQIALIRSGHNEPPSSGLEG